MRSSSPTSTPTESVRTAQAGRVVALSPKNRGTPLPPTASPLAVRASSVAVVSASLSPPTLITAAYATTLAHPRYHASKVHAAVPPERPPATKSVWICPRTPRTAVHAPMLALVTKYATMALATRTARTTWRTATEPVLIRQPTKAIAAPVGRRAPWAKPVPPANMTLCDGSCVDTTTNPDHCGQCDRSCPHAGVCSGGECVFECASGESGCGGACVSLDNDANNCGSCGRSCPWGASCQSGECVCPGGLTPCADTCINTMTDALHCGGCDQACGAGEACVGGVCL